MGGASPVNYYRFANLVLEGYVEMSGESFVVTTRDSTPIPEPGLPARLTLVAAAPGAIAEVMVRALEPVDGLPLMQQRRGMTDPRALCSGPGKLCQALGIRLDQQGADLTGSSELWFAAGAPVTDISVSGRIGISKAQDAPWRYWESGSPFVSAHRRGEPYRDEVVP